MPSPLYGWFGTTPTRIQTNVDGILKVRGENQLFSFQEVLASSRPSIISGAGGYGDSTPVTAGEIWVVTNVVAGDETSPTTAHRHYARHNGALTYFYRQAAAFAAVIPSVWAGHVYLDPSDTIRVYFDGALAGDSVTIRLTGYIMTLET